MVSIVPPRLLGIVFVLSYTEHLIHVYTGEVLGPILGSPGWAMVRAEQ